MTVGTDQCQARLAEPLHVNGMANPVAGSAVPDAEASASAPQKQMFVSVEVIVLDQVVVHILCGKPDLYAINPHRFELEHDKRAEHVL